MKIKCFVMSVLFATNLFGSSPQVVLMEQYEAFSNKPLDNKFVDQAWNLYEEALDNGFLCMPLDAVAIKLGVVLNEDSIASIAVFYTSQFGKDHDKTFFLNARK